MVSSHADIDILLQSEAIRAIAVDRPVQSFTVAGHRMQLPKGVPGSQDLLSLDVTDDNVFGDLSETLGTLIEESQGLQSLLHEFCSTLA